MPLLFLLTRPLRGATPLGIHSLAPDYISTHTPLAGRDVCTSHYISLSEFLLTRPLRGATRFDMRIAIYARISTHTPLAGRDAESVQIAAVAGISTHTPLAGRDAFGAGAMIPVRHFYSHAPCGARPVPRARPQRREPFLLTRPLRGATVLFPVSACDSKFLLTRPLRGATSQIPAAASAGKFLLTRPLRGATAWRKVT